MLLRIGPSSDQIRSAGVNRHTKARTRSSLANRVTVWTVVATARNVGETSCCSFMRGHLEPDSAKIEPPVLHRRAPEVDPRHRPRKRKQRVDRPVIGADHALQLRLEGIERFPEGDEYQSRPGRVRPGHRAPQDEGFRRKAFLRGSLHVRGKRRTSELLVVAFAAADRVVLFLARHRGEPSQIVPPLLPGDNARAAESRPLVLHDRRFDGFLPLRILCAILVTRQIEPAAVFECVDDADRLEGGRENLPGLARAEHDLAAVFPAQPAPEGSRSRRDFEVLASVMRKRSETLDLLLQREEQQRTEPDDAGLAVRGRGQGAQRSLRRHALLQPEREIAGMPRNRGQDSRLSILQSVVPFTLTLGPKPRDRLGDALDGDDLEPVYFLLRQVRFGNDRTGKAQLGGFLKAFLTTRRRAHFAREADFAEYRELLRQRLVDVRGDDGEQHREVGGWLADANAPDRVHEHVLIVAGDSRVAVPQPEQAPETGLLPC